MNNTVYLTKHCSVDHERSNITITAVERNPLAQAHRNENVHRKRHVKKKLYFKESFKKYYIYSGSWDFEELILRIK